MNMKNAITPERIFKFIDREIPRPEPFIDKGLLNKQSIMFVGGASKQGKSILVENMAFCLATGRNFLLQFGIPRPVKILMIQAEIAEASMQNRMMKMSNTMLKDMIEAGEKLDRHKVPFYLVNYKGLKLDKEPHRNTIKQCIEYTGAEVVILDPFYKFHCKDENRANDMQYILSILDKFVAECGVSFVIVHHHGKPSENRREGAQQLRGSSVIFDYGDSYLTLNRVKSKSKEYVKLLFQLRNAEDPPDMTLYRNPETLWYEVVTQESSATLSGYDLHRKLKEYGGSLLRQELIDRLIRDSGLSERSISRAVKDAKDQGLITSEKLITDKGASVIYHAK